MTEQEIKVTAAEIAAIEQKAVERFVEQDLGWPAKVAVWIIAALALLGLVSLIAIIWWIA